MDLLQPGRQSSLLFDHPEFSVSALLLAGVSMLAVPPDAALCHPLMGPAAGSFASSYLSALQIEATESADAAVSEIQAAVKERDWVAVAGRETAREAARRNTTEAGTVPGTGTETESGTEGGEGDAP